MNIFTKTFIPNQHLHTPEFCLFPTSLDFNESDFQAVMQNKELLRTWSQSEWPEDSFTEEQNYEDLKLHIQDNIDHSAYGHMIYSPDRTTCYGSLYISPISTITENYSLTSEQLQRLEHFDARIDYWVISGVPELEETITKEIRRWLTDEWKIKPLFALRPKMDVRKHIYAKLQFQKEFELRGKEARLELYV